MREVNGGYFLMAILINCKWSKIETKCQKTSPCLLMFHSLLSVWALYKQGGDVIFPWKSLDFNSKSINHFLMSSKSFPFLFSQLQNNLINERFWHFWKLYQEINGIIKVLFYAQYFQMSGTTYSWNNATKNREFNTLRGKCGLLVTLSCF